MKNKTSIRIEEASLGTVLRLLRCLFGQSHAELSKGLHISTNALHKYEIGLEPLFADQVLSICKHYNFPLNQFFNLSNMLRANNGLLLSDLSSILDAIDIKNEKNTQKTQVVANMRGDF
jgi:hypothetical protein